LGLSLLETQREVAECPSRVTDEAWTVAVCPEHCKTTEVLVVVFVIIALGLLLLQLLRLLLKY